MCSCMCHFGQEIPFSNCCLCNTFFGPPPPIVFGPPPSPPPFLPMKKDPTGLTPVGPLSGGTTSIAPVSRQNKYRLSFPSTQFGTIYADPPWRLQNGGVKRKLHYDTMDLDEIKSMGRDIQQVSLPDSHLWLWTTNPHLPESLEVMKAWGFEYKTCLTWDKQLMGLGFWLRSRTEHCLWGVKSNKGRSNPGNITTLLVEKRRKHSQKPDGIIPIIEKLSPGPYLEIFSRNSRPGWTCLQSDAKPLGDPYGQG